MPVVQGGRQVQVGDQPRGVAQTAGRRLQRGGRRLQHAGSDEQRQAGDALLGLPALDLLGGDVERVHHHAVPAGVDAQHHAPGVQARAQRRGELLGQPAVALRPGQHARVLVWRGLGAGGGKAMAAGKVVQARPRGHHANARAVVVTAAVVQVPAQRGAVQLLLVQPRLKSHPIQSQQIVGYRLV